MPAAQVPLFDALAHPTLSARFRDRPEDTRFESLVTELEASGFLGACAVGLDGVGGYAHEPYLAACRAHANLVPVAGFDPGVEDPAGAARALKELGYTALKIHPRFSGYAPTSDHLGSCFAAAQEADLTVFFCTYYYDRLERYPGTDPLFTLVEALKRAPRTRVVLVHGGDVRLLEYAQLVRHNPNLLLDLSFTMLKYRGSSIDADVAHVCSALDRRVCVGADHPEFSHEALRARFDELVVDLPEEKSRNVGYRNLIGFLGAEIETP